MPVLKILVHTHRLPMQVALFFFDFGVATVACAVPLFNWANWMCPRCPEEVCRASLIPVL
jgi:hypothetical protein